MIETFSALLFACRRLRKSLNRSLGICHEFHWRRTLRFVLSSVWSLFRRRVLSPLSLSVVFLSATDLSVSHEVVLSFLLSQCYRGSLPSQYFVPVLRMACAIISTQSGCRCGSPSGRPGYLTAARFHLTSLCVSLRC